MLNYVNIQMNIYSLSLVLTLRRHVKTLRQMASSSAQMEGVSATASEAVGSSNTKDRWIFRHSAALGTSSKHDIALHRLTSDLTYSVPLTIILILGLMACTICIMAYDFVAPSWAVSEYVRISDNIRQPMADPSLLPCRLKMASLGCTSAWPMP